MHGKPWFVCRSLRRLAAIALVPACLAAAGCAGSALADFDSESPVAEKAAPDDSFPSASEVGLNDADASPPEPDGSPR